MSDDDKTIGQRIGEEMRVLEIERDELRAEVAAETEANRRGDTIIIEQTATIERLRARLEAGRRLIGKTHTIDCMDGTCNYCQLRAALAEPTTERGGGVLFPEMHPHKFRPSKFDRTLCAVCGDAALTHKLPAPSKEPSDE
jgi:hypothetical protein